MSLHTPSRTPVQHRLGRHELLRIVRPARLQVEHGTLWVTQDNRPVDVIVEAGGCYEHDGRSPMIASPLSGPVRLTVRDRAHAPSATGLAGWRRLLGPRLGRLLLPTQA